MGLHSIAAWRRVSALFFVACGLYPAGFAAAAPKRDRGEPPPLRAADLGPKSERVQDENDPIDKALLHSEDQPVEKPEAGAAPRLTCQAERPGATSGEAKVVCSDGKSYTMRSAGLMLPTNTHCSTEHPECCQVGYGSMRDLQIADLLRVGRGQPPICHVHVEEVKTNPPVAAAPSEFSEDDAPPGVRSLPPLGIAITSAQSCPANMYLVSGRCYDTRELMRYLRPKTLEDKNRVLVAGADSLVAELRRDFDASGVCPDGLDNPALLRFDDQARRRANEAPLDVTPLIARPETPGLSRPEPQLPVVCSYHAATQNWLQTSFHCTNQNLCFAQSQTALPHNCIRFERATGRGKGIGNPNFFPLSHCQDLPSCFASPSGECVGVARLVALGSGLFLIAQEDAKQQRNDFGIIFSRRLSRTPIEIAVAKQARTLLHQIGRLYLSGEERAHFNALIDSQPE